MALQIACAPYSHGPDPDNGQLPVDCAAFRLNPLIFLPSLDVMADPRFKPTPVLRERRRARCAHFRLTDSRGVLIDVIVRDISSRGLSAAALGQPPAVNEVVRAQLEDGSDVWGLVRWCEGNLFGVEFDVHGAMPTRPS